MKTWRTLVAFAFFFSVSSGAVYSDTHYVSASGSQTPPFTNWATATHDITLAVAAADDFDTVLVTNDVYYIGGAMTIVVTNAVTLRSVNGDAVTILDHMGWGGPIVELRASGARLEGFTVMRGASAAQGGGVYCAGGTVVEACTIISNSATKGSGVYLSPGSTVRVSTITANTGVSNGQEGGGVYCVSGAVEQCTITLNRSYNGGGIYCIGGSIRDCVVSSNTVSSQGGDGGGIYFDGGGTAENCRVEANEQLVSGVERGGGVFFNSGGLLRNSLVTCHSGIDGAGVYCNGGGRIENCTIVNNSATNDGDGVYCNGGGELENSIVYFNSGGPDVGTTGSGMTFSHTCAGNTLSGDNNITNNPRFVDRANLNFHLSPESPCKDTGTNQGWMVGATDLDGLDRILSGVVDRGAYETPFSVDFTAAPEQGFAPLTSVFTAAVAGDPAQILFQWDFEDNGGWDQEGMGLDVVTNVYGTPGHYDVRLSASNAVGETASLSKPNYIYSVPSNIYVSLSGSHTPPFADWGAAAINIQDALDECLDSCVVWLTNHTFMLTSQVVVTKSLMIRGVDDSRSATVDGGGAVRCFEIRDSGAVLQDLTIQNGGNGGVRATSGVTIVGCTVRGNSGEHNGGGLHLGGYSMVSNCLVESNTCCNNGIGIYCDGSLIKDSIVRANRMAGAPNGYYGGGIYCNASTVRHCQVYRNSSYSRGGGVYATGGSLVDDCVILYNTNSAYYGGGVAVLGDSRLQNSSIYANRAAWGGGGVSLESGTVSDCDIRNNYCSMGGGIWIWNGLADRCTIRQNTASHGAGVLFTGGTLRNSLVYDNAATAEGGGGHVTFGGKGNIENCTIIHNTAASGGRFYAWENATGTVQNSIVYLNTATTVGDNHYTVGDSSFSNTCTTPPLSGSGNFDADPQFVDPAGLDFRLLPGSPCIDIGENDAWMTGATDRDGEARLFNTYVDLGCYESYDAALQGNFIADVAVAPGPRYVVFTAYTGGTNASGLYYSWDFDNDGTNDVEGFGLDVVSNLYSGSGYYTPVLTISNAAGEVWTQVRSNYIGMGYANLYASTAGGHIDPYTNWANAATNIQAAVDVGMGGSTVLVAQGTYDLTSTLLMTDAVTVVSADGVGLAILDGGSAVRCATLKHGGAVLDGFTLRNGSSPATGGGGVYVRRDAVVQNCTIVSNTATDVGGGGAFVYYVGVISNCTIRYNAAAGWAGGGGVLLMSGGHAVDCRVAMNSCNEDGGGIHLNQGGVAVGCVISNNTCGTQGGGVSCASGGLVEDCRIVNNQKTGAKALWGGTFRRCTISHNTGSTGGGIRLQENEGMENCVISHNTSSSHGGGIRLTKDVSLVNCTIADNLSSNRGGGLYVTGSSGDSVSLVNCIVWSNAAVVMNDNYYIKGGSMDCSYTCIDPDPGGLSNVTADPLFVDGPAGDHRLTLSSPCIDVGWSNGMPVVDRNNVPRPLNGDNTNSSMWDLGAYEYVSDTADTDGDWLTDSQEVYQYGTSPVIPDSDGDGQTDGEEAIAGTDPGSSSSYFEVAETSPPTDTSGLVLCWVAHTGRLYKVKHTADLMGGWSDLPGCTNMPGIEGTMCCTNSNPNATNLFYTINVRME